ncbi:MAG TPA: galactokinase [Actinomycetes bacterium]|nr:galactokinase [Actinomycetes bacterium]
MTPPDEVRSAFRELAGDDPEGVWSSPGRVNLIGEHTDYNDGYALPFGIPARAWVAVARREDGVLRMRSVQRPGEDATVPVDGLAPGQLTGWPTYLAGVVWAARRADIDVPGIDVLVDGRVPPGSGLSSSHALECALATALNDLLDAGLDRNALARLSQITENEFVGAPTGMLDQMASLHAQRGHALFLDNRTLFVEQVPLDPAGTGLRLVIVDTTVHHDNADGAYGERRATCEGAAEVLGVPALRDVSLDDLADALERLPEDEARRCVRHVVTEDQRVLDAVAALRSGDWTALAAAMDASHASLRDDYRVSSPELDVAVETARSAGALGSRMTGAGFGGSTISLVPEERVAAVRDAVTEAFGERGWAGPVVGETEPGDGARRDS